MAVIDIPKEVLNNLPDSVSVSEQEIYHPAFGRNPAYTEKVSTPSVEGLTPVTDTIQFGRSQIPYVSGYTKEVSWEGMPTTDVNGYPVPKFYANYDADGNFKNVKPELGYAYNQDVLIQPEYDKSGKIVATNEMSAHGNEGGIGSFISGALKDFGPMIAAGLGANLFTGANLLGEAGGLAGASASDIAASNALANANLAGYAGTDLAATAASGTGGLSSVFNNLTDTATNFTQKLGESLLPNADPALQKLAGQVVTNTVTNGGDLKQAIVNTGLSYGTGALGNEIADVTGSDMAGRVASQTMQQLFTTGDVDPSKLAGSELSRLVGSQVADETGSNLAGKAASSVTNSVLQGKDASSGLLSLGINEAVNQGANAISDFGGVFDTNNQVDTTQTSGGGLNAVVDNSAQETTGGLNQVANLDETTNANQLTGQSNADDVLSTVGNQDVGTIQEQPIDTSKVATVDTRGLNTQTGTNVTPTIVGGATAGANILKNVLTTGAKKALTSSLVGAKPAPRPQQSAAQLAAMKIAATKPTRPPTQMDVSKLMPIQKVTQPVSRTPQKVNVSTLTPIKNTASLTSILKNKNRIG